MERVNKFAIWGIGVLLLAFLIQFPIQQSEETWGDSWSLPLSGKTIVIDPGHGGPDGGAVGKDKTVEKEISLAVAKKLQNYLQQNGALVYLTREEDKDLAQDDTKGLSRRKAEDIRNRLAFIHDKNPDFFVTIHLNALPSTRWSGAQTFYYPEFDESKHLAKMIQSEIIRNLENTTRSPLAINGIYLLKHAEVPGALVEIGFLSNEQERELLKQDDYQQKMAASIYEGILRYATTDVEEQEEK
ncbi:N-acetylmuramoyl-L-alanine amidase CwlD [Virgibacillus profundi]|uniref:N-acetylmuramoyl-L-alanine amidase CwlD n=1 Tax=Virgibacillus profundi TaxID=2024555 RepID=A0A2A2I9P2_9BACI|nr:N-acetylmuramoyl-L-alanine amidase CwlD [Virgibacillus profundi]PAV27855.1 N-acetylmuramoyl-L-alanine amidase CwlD [Virgibacillus profundi]PXY52033.1 N-acetylmuramoyl-L-alanine amidase CwlD [Virgibacillus profundi]